jgi:hypothetical protein
MNKNKRMLKLNGLARVKHLTAKPLSAVAPNISLFHESTTLRYSLSSGRSPFENIQKTPYNVNIPRQRQQQQVVIVMIIDPSANIIIKKRMPHLNEIRIRLDQNDQRLHQKLLKVASVEHIGRRVGQVFLNFQLDLQLLPQKDQHNREQREHNRGVQQSLANGPIVRPELSVVLTKLPKPYREN